MKVVIVGDGKVGYTLSEQLSREGHDIVVVDNKRDVLRGLSEKLDVMVLPGNGASLAVLKAAGAPESDLVIAATSSDEVNLLCCVVARKLGCPNTIARVRNPEYAEQLYLFKDDLRLSMTINPELTAAREIHRLLQLPGFLQRDAFAKGRVEIVEFEILPDSPLAGAQLSHMHRLTRVKVLVCAVDREGGVIIPDGAFVIEPGDKLYVTASTRDLNALVRALGLSRRKTRGVMIIGGSRIAHYLTALLLEGGVRVKIIEKEGARCLELAERLPKADIVQGDGTDRDVLMAEGIADMDAVVTLTNIDEENLMVSLYANFIKVPTVITKINRTEYAQLLKGLGIDRFISPKLLCANDIVRYVRAMQNTTGGSVLTVHRLLDGKVEALEFRATASTRHLGETLTKITLKPHILIACIIRAGRVIIPSGADTIEAGDTLIVVAAADRAIYDLNDIFSDRL